MENKEKLKDFEIMTIHDSKMLIEELKKEIDEEDYDLKYIEDLAFYGHFNPNRTWKEYYDYVDDEIEINLLLKSARSGKADIVKVLLEEAGADPNIRIEDKYTENYIALHFASQEGNLEMVQALLEHPETDPNLQDSGGYTALHRAVLNGDKQKEDYDDYCDVVQVLLYHQNIDPNLQNMFSETALHLASRWGHSQVVQALLSHPSTDTTLTNKEGQTAWDVAKPEIREQFPQLKP